MLDPGDVGAVLAVLAVLDVRACVCAVRRCDGRKQGGRRAGQTRPLFEEGAARASGSETAGRCGAKGRVERRAVWVPSKWSSRRRKQAGLVEGEDERRVCEKALSGSRLWVGSGGKGCCAPLRDCQGGKPRRPGRRQARQQPHGQTRPTARPATCAAPPARPPASRQAPTLI